MSLRRHADLFLSLDGERLEVWPRSRDFGRFYGAIQKREKGSVRSVPCSEQIVGPRMITATELSSSAKKFGGTGWSPPKTD